MDEVEAMALLRRERERQGTVEGYTADHDDAHVDGEILTAAMLYLWHGTDRAALTHASHGEEVPMGWPWTPDSWRPRDRLANLVRSGGLCQAERDRLVRAGRPHGHVDDKITLVVREMTTVRETAAA